MFHFFPFDEYGNEITRTWYLENITPSMESFLGLSWKVKCEEWKQEKHFPKANKRGAAKDQPQFHSSTQEYYDESVKCLHRRKLMLRKKSNWREVATWYAKAVELVNEAVSKNRKNKDASKKSGNPRQDKENKQNKKPKTDAYLTQVEMKKLDYSLLEKAGTHMDDSSDEDGDSDEDGNE